MNVHTRYKNVGFEKEIILPLGFRDATVKLTLPDPPNLKDVMGYNRPRTEHKWRRSKLPNFWDDRYLDRVNQEKYKGKNPHWWRTDATKEMIKFHDQEWDRRENGFWLMINGKLTWMTGIHYHYCSWYKIDIGYPHYRDRDLRWHYVWDYIEKDPMCYGMIYIKHRRDGASYRCANIVQEYITRTKNANGGIQSKTKDDAEEFFRTKIVYPFKKLPAFFKPFFDGTDTPSSKYEFKRPGQRLNSATFLDDELLSQIDYQASTYNAYDGFKLQRAVWDESSKLDVKCNLDEAWPILRECLTDGPRRYKAMLPTTVNFKENNPASFERFQQLVEDSDPNRKSALGMTTSGLIPYFRPCYDGLKEDFFDEFGGSVIDDPTPEQLRRLIKLHPESADIKLGMGARSFEEATREDLKKKGLRHKLADRMRLYPFKIEEAFYRASGQMFWDPIIIQNTMDTLTGKGPDGLPNIKNYLVYGNLEFIEPNWGWHDGKWVGTVKFESCHKDDARFHMRRQYGFDGMEKVGLRYNAVNVANVSGRRILKPTQEHAFIIGVDPIEFDKDHVTSKDISQAAAYGFRKFNTALDGGSDVSDWVTNGYIFEYMARPDLSETFYEDMLKACIFYSTKIHAESQSMKPMYDYFVRMGAVGFIKFRPQNTMGVSKASQKVRPGTPGNELIHKEGFEKIAEFVKKYMTPYSFPFPRGCKQLLTFDYKKKTKFDLVIANVYTAVLASEQTKNHKEEKKLERKVATLLPRYTQNGRKSQRIKQRA